MVYDVSSLQLEVDTKKRLLHKHYSKFQHGTARSSSSQLASNGAYIYYRWHTKCVSRILVNLFMFWFSMECHKAWRRVAWRFI